MHHKMGPVHIASEQNATTITRVIKVQRLATNTMVFLDIKHTHTSVNYFFVNARPTFQHKTHFFGKLFS